MTRYALAACAIIRTIKNLVEAENYLRKLANETGYDRDILARQVGAATPQREFAPRARRDRGGVKAARDEGTLLALVGKGLVPPETISPDDFDSSVNARAAQWLIEGNPISSFVVNLPEEARAQLMADLYAEQLPDDPAVALDMARDMLFSIRDRRRKDEIERLKEMLPTADEEQKKELLARISQLMREARN
jgi:hypothetical protein